MGKCCVGDLGTDHHTSLGPSVLDHLPTGIAKSQSMAKTTADPTESAELEHVTEPEEMGGFHNSLPLGPRKSLFPWKMLLSVHRRSETSVIC